MNKADPKAKAVIFDMDGVLIDSSRTHYEAWRRVCVDQGRELTWEEFLPSIGTGNDTTVRLLFGDDAAARVDELAALKEPLYRKMLRGNPHYIDGAADLAASLHSAGWRLALATSAPRDNVVCALERFPAAGRFSALVDADMIAATKPAPDLFLKAAEMLGVPPARCIVIEDSTAGLVAAQRAGMARVALTTTLDLAELAAHSEMVVDSLRDLSPAALDELLD